MTDATNARPPKAAMHVPLDRRGLAIVVLGHAAVLGAVPYVVPTIDRSPPPPPIMASVILPVAEEAAPAEAEPEARPPEPTRTSPPPAPREPNPQPLLAVPESAPVPAPATVAPTPVEPLPQSSETSDVRAEAPPGPPARASLESLSGDPDDVRRYIAAIMRQLNRHKTYARELKKAKIEGTVVIQFTIDREGRLLASGVKQTSGHAELDRAAMDMLARANPLPAVPDFMNRDELALAIPVEYSLITDR
jgi:protein TonB